MKQIVFLMAVMAVVAQQSDLAPKQFEVASIKPAAIGGRVNGYFIAPGGRFLGVNITPLRLLQEAFDVRDFQVVGAPSWFGAERYDIEAKADGWSTPAQLRPLVQTLLADRFKLSVHQETKGMPIYALLVGKGGSKVQPSKSSTGPTIGGSRGRINAKQVSIAMFAARLGLALGRPVVDRTELKGEFDVLLEWSAEDTASASGPSIFAALQEQLGFRLEAQKGQVEIIVIDHVEKASLN